MRGRPGQLLFIVYVLALCAACVLIIINKIT